MFEFLLPKDFDINLEDYKEQASKFGFSDLSGKLKIANTSVLEKVQLENTPVLKKSPSHVRDELDIKNFEKF
jgi:hypothetical protein